MTTRRQIVEFAQEVATRYQPVKIVLFGSHGRGDASPASDVDMLVIMNFHGSPAHKALEIRKAVKKSFPLDLIVKSPSEAKLRLQQGDPFLSEVLSSGQVLYETS